MGWERTPQGRDRTQSTASSRLASPAIAADRGFGPQRDDRTSRRPEAIALDLQRQCSYVWGAGAVSGCDFLTLNRRQSLKGAPFRSNHLELIGLVRLGGFATLHYDALLAALFAGVVTLLAFLFWPAVAYQLPDVAQAAIIYLLVLLVGAWISHSWRRTRRK